MKTPALLSEEEIKELEKAAGELGYESSREYIVALHQMYRNGQVHIPRKSIRPLESDTVRPKVAFERPLGRIYHGDSAILMQDTLPESSVDLIVTSPPFGLVKEKAYGNQDADKYVDWFEQFAHGFNRVLKENGSLVIDIGGAWKKGVPVRSLYHYELLIRLCRGFGFHLAQEFYWWNPAKLPLPAEWVNIRRVRVKDSVNCVWWLSKTPFPRASNKRVLQPYSKSMDALLARGTYNTAARSGGHKPGETSFLTRHKGSIPHNLIAAANTESNGAYQQYCRRNNLPVHPARFPSALPAFFIRMLTNRGDTVLDPFGGSCITGEVAEQMGRRWICCELDENYVEGAKGRFPETAGELFPSFQSARTEPYMALPPTLSLLTEEEAALVEDGGKGPRPISPSDATNT